MRLRPGDTFDRYVIEALLGEGGMGEVYQARDVRLERRVALKVLRREAAEDPEAWNRALVRMLREARAAAALNHRNTVAIYDIGDVEGQPYLAMELIEGESLRRLLGGSASVTTKLGWLLDVARALSAAHRAGLVHRDVKPENVMLRSDGTIKVLDFGIARRVQFDVDEVASTQRGEAEAPLTPAAGNRTSVLPASADTVTGEGVMVGTPAYMAPEQLRGEPVDARTDQFGWGVLAYELLTGKVPFGAGLDGVRLLSAILSDEPPSLDGIVPHAVERVLRRTVAKRKTDRLPSMDHVIEALVAHVGADSSDGIEDVLIGGPDSTMPETGDTPEVRAARRQTARPPAVLAPPDPESSSRSEPTQASKHTPTHTQRSPDLEKGARITPAPPTPIVRVEKAGQKVGAAATTLESPTVVASASLPRSRSIWFWAAASVGAIWIAAAVIWGYWLARREQGPMPSASAAPAPAATPITELPIVGTTNTEALAAYKEGLQALRDASWDSARVAFERATKADPSFGAAHLRLAMTHQFRRDTPSTRAAFQRAMQLQATLSPRDRVLLDVFEPVVQRDPPDNAETIARIDAASLAYPGDAELVYLRILMNAKTEPSAALALTERCVELDPKYADCLQARSFFLSRLGRDKDSLETLDQCVEAAPAAVDCVLERIYMYKYMGRCDKLEADARRLLAKDQASPTAYRELAVALAAQGKPSGAVGVAVDQAARRFKEAGQIVESDELRIEWSILSGNFDEAEKLAKGLQQAIEGEPFEERHVVPARLLVLLYREIEQDKRAAEVADRFLTQRAAWTRPALRTIWSDATGVFLEAKHAGGMLDDAAYDAAREAWAKEWSGSVREIDKAAIWLNGYAAAARNQHDARRAFAAEPVMRPALYYSTQLAPMVEVLVGGVHFLAGDYDRAAPHLELASRACTALDEPLLQTLATYRVGVVRESKNDKPGACTAYRTVLSRWGREKRSVTARSAAQRAKALKCDD